MKAFKPLIPLAAVGILLSACGHTLEERAATGALGGAAVGAATHGVEGALIGGAAGAAAGAAYHELKKN